MELIRDIINRMVKREPVVEVVQEKPAPFSVVKTARVDLPFTSLSYCPERKNFFGAEGRAVGVLGLDGKKIKSIPTSLSSVGNVSVSESGRLLVVWSEKTFIVFDMLTQAGWGNHASGAIADICLKDIEKTGLLYVATYSGDVAVYSVHNYVGDKGEPRLSQKYVLRVFEQDPMAPRFLHGVTVSDEHLVAVTSTGVSVIDPEGVIVANLEIPAQKALFLPTGDLLVASLGRIYCWSSADEDGCGWLYDGSSRAMPMEDTITHLAASPDGRYLVAGTVSGKMGVWDLANNDLLVYPVASEKFVSTLFLAENYFATLTGDNELGLYYINHSS
jgi:WD40 repeat protein